MRDALSGKQIKKLLAPVAASTNDTAFVSAIIDVLGYNACTLLLITGTDADADATFTALLEESNDSGMSGATAVADADMISQTAGTAPEAAASYDFGDDAEVRSIGYVGIKRYIRLTVTPSGNTGNAFLAGIAVLEEPAVSPVVHAAS